MRRESDLFLSILKKSNAFRLTSFSNGNLFGNVQKTKKKIENTSVRQLIARKIQIRHAVCTASHAKSAHALFAGRHVHERWPIIMWYC